ncbi:DEAD/DEAH box helicase [Falsarthrobacter nasiphocae]|uniref:ATP-dependent RNA helicase HelY n=1 Tax=Falsarthrobacter nasiphocae TaxID=189863 RepID=A0AAE4C747_9MICC|nr:DEAD/DEAH box helicase [Falsarthrobacter nasiphocae]MDR6891100.1 ATP-dependent RNA helicase HelY [Falsarthrobacter nasiphocae]
MTTPAERYEAMRIRHAEAATELSRFAAAQPFPLDEFQREACRSIEAGRGVLVAAPTGAGKTIVGEFAVHLALARGQKAFYTTPIKALSNQKYHDLCEALGSHRVGLLTGDTSINGEADVVVMTTEVLRNMLYAGSSTVASLGFVVMDEVHYLADRFRGAVWEEVIIHLPESVTVVSLSATVSNAEEFGAWLGTVRGETDVVVSEHRPVPLTQHVMVRDRLVDLFEGHVAFDELAQSGGTPHVNPELIKLARSSGPSGFGRGRRGSGPRGKRPSHSGHGGGGPSRASRPRIIASLAEQGLLPAIVFIFSRKGCEQAVRQCVEHGAVLTTASERTEIQRVVDQVASLLPPEDLDVVGFWSWREGVLKGYGAHHAGMLPVVKEAVEALFGAGLIKAVFATETLALGVNMPARSVVLEKLDKFNGESHVAVTPGEYTQLTGRAGRRGIDVEGHAVVLWDRDADPAQIADLASTRTYPLNSSFAPTYNMSINLVARFGLDRARSVLESSFAQFQADRGVVGLARQVRERERALAGFEESMRCERGDVAEYLRLRRELSEAEKRARRHSRKAQSSAVAASLERLQIGDVIEVPSGRLKGKGVIIDADAVSLHPRPSILTLQRTIRRISVDDLAEPVEVVTTMKVPRRFTGRSPKERRDLVSALKAALDRAGSAPRRSPLFSTAKGEDDASPAAEVRRRLRAHPVHGCPERDEHVRWGERHAKLARETSTLRARIRGRTNTISRQFDKVCDVLRATGYLTEQSEVTPQGAVLSRIYGDRDLLTAQMLNSGELSGLEPAELAALVSLLVYQGKREHTPGHIVMPTEDLQERYRSLVRIWSRVTDEEERAAVPLTPDPDPGLMRPVWRWAQGATLRRALEGSDLAAGDFVRWAKQVVDSLDQLRAASGDPSVRGCAEEAMDALRRGVVAAG